MKIDTIVGVDFSGARLAGKNIWLAWTRANGERLQLTRLARLEDLAETAERKRGVATPCRINRRIAANVMGD